MMILQFGAVHFNNTNLNYLIIFKYTNYLLSLFFASNTIKLAINIK